MSINAGTIASIASAVASAFSAAIAWGAMQQAARAATFPAKSEAISYMHAAVAALQGGQSSTTRGELLRNIRMAKQLADRVFSVGVRTELNNQRVGAPMRHRGARHGWNGGSAMRHSRILSNIRLLLTGR
jgi:hypothetical protein